MFMLTEWKCSGQHDLPNHVVLAIPDGSESTLQERRRHLAVEFFSNALHSDTKSNALHSGQMIERIDTKELTLEEMI